MPRPMRDIVFATFNLHNLQMPGKATYPGSAPLSEAEFAAKTHWQGTMLRELDADVVVFQELWTAEALDAVLEASGMAAEYTTAFIKDGPWDGVAVAAAVRAPWEIRGVTRHKAFPDALRLAKRKRSMAEIQAAPPEADLEMAPAEAETFTPSQEDEGVHVAIDEFSRSVLQVSIGNARASDVPTIEVFGAHLKSKLATMLDNEEYRDPSIKPHRAALGTALSTIRRVAEAAALRIILTDVMKDGDAPVAVLGDLNDGQFSDPLAILSGQPSFRVVATSRAAARSDTGLYSGVALQQLRSLGDVYYTHEHRDVRGVIDHVLVSEQFYDWSDRRLWAFKEMRFYNDHVPVEHREATDHGVVRAEFDWSPAG